MDQTREFVRPLSTLQSVRSVMFVLALVLLHRRRRPSTDRSFGYRSFVQLPTDHLATNRSSTYRLPVRLFIVPNASPRMLALTKQDGFGFFFLNGPGTEGARSNVHFIPPVLVSERYCGHRCFWCLRVFACLLPVLLSVAGLAVTLSWDRETI